LPGQDISVQTPKVIDTTHFSIKIAQYIPTPVPQKQKAEIEPLCETTITVSSHSFFSRKRRRAALHYIKKKKGVKKPIEQHTPTHPYL